MDGCCISYGNAERRELIQNDSFLPIIQPSIIKGDGMPDDPMSSDDIEKIVEMSKQITEKDGQISSLTEKITDYEKLIEKQKLDIIKLQKIISDNFVATKEQPKTEISASKTFNDIYKQMIENNKK